MKISLYLITTKIRVNSGLAGHSSFVVAISSDLGFSLRQPSANRPPALPSSFAPVRGSSGPVQTLAPALEYFPVICSVFSKMLPSITSDWSRSYNLFSLFELINDITPTKILLITNTVAEDDAVRLTIWQTKQVHVDPVIIVILKLRSMQASL